MRQTIPKGVLGERIRDWAALKGIPISGLEKSAGLSPGMISRWIAAGDEDYSVLSRLAAIADMLGISLDELIGRRTNDLSAAAQDGPIPRLQSETCAGQLLWLPWQTVDDFPETASLAVCNSGRPCCGGWWAEREGLKFFLACFCDDIQDEDELLELSLHCTPGHKLPLVRVQPDSDSALSELYTQILLRAAFAAEKDTGVLDLRSQGNVDSGTIPFRAQSR